MSESEGIIFRDRANSSAIDASIASRQILIALFSMNTAGREAVCVYGGKKMWNRIYDSLSSIYIPQGAKTTTTPTTTQGAKTIYVVEGGRINM